MCEYFFYFSSKTYGVGTQNNCLDEMVLLSSLKHMLKLMGTCKKLFTILLLKAVLIQGTKNISILHLSCRTSDLQFSLILKTHSLSFKRICNKEHQEVICNMTSSSNSSRSTRPTGRELWGDLFVLSRISLVITSGRVEFVVPYNILTYESNY